MKVRRGQALAARQGAGPARPGPQTVLETVAQQGPQAAFKKVMNRLDSYTPLGYSLCGRVVEVGAGVTGFPSASGWPAPATSTPCTPRSTGCRSTSARPCPTVSIPATPPSRRSAPSPCRACARPSMGARRGRRRHRARAHRPAARAAAATPRVSASWASTSPPSAAALAEDAGGRLCRLGPRAPDLDRVVAALAELTRRLRRRRGVPGRRWRHQRPRSSWPPSLARDRGRVVDIGKCSLDLPWNAYYEKELDVRFSRSYGPGRYDPIYEERRHRLPGRLRALDRGPQPRVLPRPARPGPDRPGAAHLGRRARSTPRPPTYERLEQGRAAGHRLPLRVPGRCRHARTVERPAGDGRRQPTPDRSPASSRCGSASSVPATTPSTMLLPHLVKPRPTSRWPHVATSPARSPA